MPKSTTTGRAVKPSMAVSSWRSLWSEVRPAVAVLCSAFRPPASLMPRRFIDFLVTR
jgi:hypothetical protein